MKTILQNVLAVVVGLLLGSALNMALVLAGSQVFPLPEGVDANDPQSLGASAHVLKPQHFVFPFLAHAGGTLFGALVAYLVAATRRDALSYVIGAFFLTGGIAAARMIPAPMWFIVLDLLVAYIPMAWLAISIGRRIRPPNAIS